ncbi:ATP-binding protein [Ferdinandcohnia quinoae]|uniref:histidine kinase n=1 Tax=Fredinandcohnia quinoae TaxID=2918902 RepID=A0AAW5E104_9BACI|nr:ATP-binding protein [Fredinandcohnia sp. SECRCQ15]MCH1626288.1 ATP-binding protein [Fredinandcohnia sp. SECRCQ15]
MLYNIGHVLYHVLIVIFLILIYYLFVINHKRMSSQIEKYKLLSICLVMLLLTMTFPVPYADGFSYDFRVIPIIIAFLYGGILQGITTIGIMLLYRYFLGGPGFFVTLINYLVAIIILLIINKNYHKSSIKWKVIKTSIFYWFIALTRGITLIKMKHLDQLPFMLIFSVITWITLFMAIHIIENLKEQRLLKRELERSEKLNLISQLAASVAHEVRNPLTTINGFLQLISKDNNINDSQRNYIDISLNELNRAQSIINDYLSLAKPNNKETNIIDISNELNKTIELMTSYTNIQNVEIKASIQNSLYVNGNKDEIKQVLINIIKNGIEAIRTNGVLKINSYFKDGFIIIEIIDNGIGMTKKQLSNIGTPFYSTKEIGTGIGLTVSYKIIELMKGKIEVESNVDIGTTFTIKLPGCVRDKITP